jgi:hypothetical protein
MRCDDLLIWTTTLAEAGNAANNETTAAANVSRTPDNNFMICLPCIIIAGMIPSQKAGCKGRIRTQPGLILTRRCGEHDDWGKSDDATAVPVSFPTFQITV